MSSSIELISGAKPKRMDAEDEYQVEFKALLVSTVDLAVQLGRIRTLQMVCEEDAGALKYAALQVNSLLERSVKKCIAANKDCQELKRVKVEPRQLNSQDEKSSLSNGTGTGK